MKKTALFAIVTALLLSLALAACSSDGGSTDTATPEGTTVETLSSSVVKFSLGSTSDSADAQVTINKDEGLLIASKLDSGEAEIVSQVPGGDSTDYAYEGCSVSQTEVEAGTFTVTVKPTEATGTIYVLSYPAGQLDILNTDSEDLFNQVLEFVGSAS